MPADVRMPDGSQTASLCGASELAPWLWTIRKDGPGFVRVVLNLPEPNTDTLRFWVDKKNVLHANGSYEVSYRLIVFVLTVVFWPVVVC